MGGSVVLGEVTGLAAATVAEALVVKVMARAGSAFTWSVEGWRLAPAAKMAAKVCADVPLRTAWACQLPSGAGPASNDCVK